MKRILSIVLLALIGIIVNAQSFNLNPAHLSSSDPRGTETVVFTNNGSTSITFDLKTVETTSRTTPKNTSINVESTETPEQLFKFLDDAPEGVSWMTVTPTSGTVAPGQSVEFRIAFSAGEIREVLSAQIFVTTNSQAMPRTNISVNLFDLATRDQCVFFTGTDNENDAHTGVADGDMDYYWCYNESPAVPIEFNIFVTETNITSALLSLYTYDVDETSGEIDQVYINGHLLGALTGNDGQWSTSVFAVNSAWVNGGVGDAGKNLIQIYITVPGWCVNVDWGQISVNGCAGEASIRYANLSTECAEPGSEVCVDIEVDSERASHNVKVEYNLLNESNVSVDGGSYTYVTTGNSDDPFTRCFDVPFNATPGSTYTVQVIVYDAASNLQEDIELVPLGIAPCAPPVPVSNWALFIGIALILTFAVIRFRRMI